MHIHPDLDALLIIDLQNDFCSDGALAVPDADAIVAPVSELASRFQTVVLTQDWHPVDHVSFASNHPGQVPFASIELPYGQQTLWPDHCIQGFYGAKFHRGLYRAADRASVIVRKGMNPQVDSYSAFFENDHTTPTGLAGYLRDRGIQRVFLVGLAYDFCVGYSAIDAVRQGFEAVVIKDLTRAIAMPLESGTTVNAMETWFAACNVRVTESSALTPGSKPLGLL